VTGPKKKKKKKKKDVTLCYWIIVFFIFVRVKELLTVITVINMAPVQTEIVFYFIPEHVTVCGTGGRHVERGQLLES